MFCGYLRSSQLHDEERDSQVLLNGDREFLEILFRRSFPEQGLAFLVHELYLFGYIAQPEELKAVKQAFPRLLCVW